MRLRETIKSNAEYGTPKSHVSPTTGCFAAQRTALHSPGYPAGQQEDLQRFEHIQIRSDATSKSQ